MAGAYIIGWPLALLSWFVHPNDKIIKVAIIIYRKPKDFYIGQILWYQIKEGVYLMVEVADNSHDTKVKITFVAS